MEIGTRTNQICDVSEDITEPFYILVDTRAGSSTVGPADGK